jgi:hypothetical protein
MASSNRGSLRQLLPDQQRIEAEPRNLDRLRINASPSAHRLSATYSPTVLIAESHPIRATGRTVNPTSTMDGARIRTVYGWEWEDFEDLIQSCHSRITDAGPLRVPICSFDVRRDEKLELRLVVRSPQDAAGGTKAPPAGAVRFNTDKVIFSSDLGLKFVAEGVHVDRSNTRIHDDPALGELVQDCSVHRIAGSIYPEDRPVTFVIDWLDNLNPIFLWPDNITTSSSGERNVVLGSGANSITMRGSSSPGGSGNRCVHLLVDGQNFFLCCADRPACDRQSKRGFIVYDGNPSHEFRDQIRRCLSFTMGLYLVYLGHTTFDSNWHTVHFEAISAYSLGGRAFELGPMPPAPLGSRYDWEIDRAMLSRSVNLIFTQYKSLNFGMMSWAYWHAVAATAHIAGAHWGAAIESLERAFLQTTTLSVKRTLLPDAEWRSIHQAIETALSAGNIDPDAAKILRNKITSLNRAPQSEVTGDLLAQLGLQFGEREKKAAAMVRNKSAHGKDDEVDLEWVRDLKLLRVRFHRMLFAMTGASDLYYDYFTLGRPTRKLADAIS